MNDGQLEGWMLSVGQMDRWTDEGGCMSDRCTDGGVSV